MNGHYFIKVNTIWLFIQLLLLCAVQHEVRGVSCPTYCVCKFDDILENNMATCTFNKTAVDISWKKKYRVAELEIICADEVENYQHECSNLPQFNTGVNETSLMVQGCAPSIMRCVHKMFTPVTIVTSFNAEMSAGSFTPDDLNDFDNVYQAQMYLMNGVTEMPAVTLNALKTVKEILIEGGNLKLSSNVLKLTKLRLLILQDNNIQDLPPNGFSGLPKLKSLNIISNKFEHVDANTFRGLDSLQALFFMDIPLTTIDPAVFSTTKQLKEFNIIRNKLNLVPNGLFADLDKLSEVSMEENQVEMILDTHAFSNLPSIRIVKLDECNIKYLPEYLFNGSVNITYIYLRGNQIKSLPPKIFATTTGLIKLDLSGNKIQNLPDGIFSELKRLDSINLSNNHLSVLKGDVFTQNSELKQVKLNGNQLTYIDQDIFKGVNIRNAYLSNNPLRCDSIVTVLIKEWFERDILRDYDDITCDNGKKLSQLLPN